MFIPTNGITLLISLVSAAMALNISKDSGEDFQVIRLKGPQGNLSRTIILPKVRPSQTTPIKTTFVPDIAANLTYLQPPEDSRFILISVSNPPLNENKEPVRKDDPRLATNYRPRAKQIRRRRRRKKLVKRKESLGVAKSNSLYKKSKFLNLFTIVSFPNDDCSDGGTCYTEAECLHMAGTIGEPCAKGYGVCCMLTTRCGTTGEINGRVFRSVGESGVCSLTINKINCAKQIKLDFINLELEAPVEGECGPERLIITGQNKNSPVPILCGFNSGQHVYLDVDESPGPVMVSVVSSNPQDFMIRVTQICDGDRLQAPKHCLQYFTEAEGFIESFNYRTDRRDQPSSGYLNNLDYTICVKKAKEMCSVTYTNEGEGIEFPFDINNLDADGEPTVPQGEAGAEVINCPDDFIAVRGIRLCGQKINDATTQPDFTLNAPIYDATNGPFMVSVVSDRSISGVGFRLHYEQLPC